MKLQFSSIILLLTVSTTSNAVLLSRLEGQAVYDTDLDITWLANANLAATNTFGITQSLDVDPIAGQIGSTGKMNWHTANTWIDGMNTANYLETNTWRLPATLDPDSSCNNSPTASTGINCSGSEMGHLFYTELAGTGLQSILTSSDPDLALFNNIEADVINFQADYYWSGTEHVLNEFNRQGWEFAFGDGFQNSRHQTFTNGFAIAVTAGDIALVPVPAAVWLFGSSLLGLLVIRRKGA